MHLADAPQTLFDLIASEGGVDELRAIRPDQKRRLMTKLGAVVAVRDAAYGKRGSVTKQQARQLDVSPHTVRAWYNAWRSEGFRALLDNRSAGRRHQADLPAATRKWIEGKIIRTDRSDTIAEIHRQVVDRWGLWRRTGDPQWAIPGFTSCPPDCGKGYPAGFSYENVRKCAPTKHAKSLGGQGTVAAYRDLPSILSTRVGTRYLQCVFFDDQKYDVHVRLPGHERSMVPMGFNALDRLTGYVFAPHIRMRYYDVEASRHRELTGKEFAWYAFTRLCTEGYRTDDAGTTYVQEHGTAKTWDNQQLRTPDGHHSFAEAVAALTGGKVSMADSGLFNKPAFAEMLYGPKSSGNPRYKAPIESFFHIVRTYQSTLRGQTGRNIDEAPEEHHGIEKYERAIFRAAEKLPGRLRDAILSNYLTGVEFARMAYLIYEALNARTHHSLEGWDKLNHYTPQWRWPQDPEDLWRPRSELAGLPDHIRDHAHHLIERDADRRLTRLQPWSPRDAKAVYESDPCIRRLDFRDAVHLMPIEWAKAVKVRDRHQLHLTDELLPGEELIYLNELTTPKGRTEFLMPGDEVRIHLNPMMPDQVLCYDQTFEFIGTLTRNVRDTGDDDRLADMFAHRARLQGALDAPVKAAYAGESDRRDAVRELNRDLVAQAAGATEREAPATPSRPARNAPAADDPFENLPATPEPTQPDADDDDEDIFDGI